MKNFFLLRKSIIFRILLLSTVFVSFSNPSWYDECYTPVTRHEAPDISTCHDTINQEDKSNLYAFIVGATPPDIEWTEEDASDMKTTLLLQKDRGLYNEVVVETLVGEAATATAILETLRKFLYFNEIEEKDVLIFYVSSHGYRDGRKFSFQGSDFSQLSPESTSVHFEDLIKILDKVTAKKLLVIDACESGWRSPKPSRSKFGIKSGKAQEAFKEIIKAKPGYTIITSSVGDSYHYDEWENSAFTEAFLEGLDGKADANNNNVITTTEIYNYLNYRVPLLCKEILLTGSDIQRPDYLKFKADIPFFALPAPQKPDGGSYTADPVLLPKSHDESGVMTFMDYELNYKPPTKMEESEKWEQEPITLFEDSQNGKPYLEGRVIFMGTEQRVGLRIEIAIEGEATGYFGRDLPIIVINFEGTKKTYFTSEFSYMYMCNYDPIRDKTFYVMAYDFTKSDKKLLESRKATSVDVGWTSGRKRYKVTHPDAFIRQLDNIRRAEEDGVIEKLKLRKR